MTLLRNAFLAFFLLLAVSAAGQTSTLTYNRQWTLVDTLARRELPRSALKVIDTLLNQARTEHNDVQLIKALMAWIDLTGRLYDFPYAEAFEKLNHGISWAGPPAQAILQNMLARAYWECFLRNGFRYQSRSTTVAIKKDDFTTWSEKEFREKINTLFDSSLQQEMMLANLSEEEFAPILTRGSAHKLRPSIFDLLAHRALECYSDINRGYGSQDAGFELDDTVAYADARTFATHIFISADSESLHYRALLLLQRLIRLHLSDTQPDALIDVDIERLNFVHQHSVMEGDAGRYAAALAVLTGQWGDEPTAAEAWYFQAWQHFESGSKYHPWERQGSSDWRDTAHRYDYLPALAICQKVIRQKDSSTGKMDCLRLLRQILAKQLSVSVERNNLPGQPMRSLISWRNCRAVYGRIVRINPMSDDLDISYREDPVWRRWSKLPAVSTFRQDLPETGDHRPHRAEVKIDALPIGTYLLIAAADPAFAIDDTMPMAAVFFNVSRLTVIRHSQDGFVVDAENGQPVAGATVRVWTNSNNRAGGLWRWRMTREYHTNANGYIGRIKVDDYSEGLEVQSGKDRMFNAAGWDAWSYGYGENEPDGGRRRKEIENRDTRLYTDRAIYRPGQPVYFKGIVTRHDPKRRETNVMAHFRTSVRLVDANGSTVDTATFITNDFGSYHGEFHLPSGRLNGDWKIYDDSTRSDVGIKVEEYKRPGFYVGFDPLKTEYRVGDSIRIEGYARAFAGNMLDGATVRYRVDRQMGYSWNSWFLSEFNGASTALAHGEAKMDKDGKFGVSFVAVPDRAISRESEPVFEYTITADITDLNGETRSGSMVVRAAWQSLQLSIEKPEPDHLPANELRTMVITATTLAGATQTTPVEVTVYSLKPPDRLIRERLWPAPDLFVLTKEEFIRQFPHDEYDNETKPENWERLRRVVTISDSTGKPLTVTGIDGKPLAPGWYVIEARGRDKYGEPVQKTRYIELYDGVTGRPVNPQYVWPLPEGVTAEPGDTIMAGIGSSATGVHVIRLVEGEDPHHPLPFDSSRTGKTYEYLRLNGEAVAKRYAVHEVDRGGFVVSDVFVIDNRFFERRYSVNVPWTNKELEISYSSWRDKLEPGGREKWGVTIRGKHGDRVAAEVLAAMYDASLDQYRIQEWHAPELPRRRLEDAWQVVIGSGSNDAQERDLPDRNLYVYNEYDRLDWPYLGQVDTKISFYKSDFAKVEIAKYTAPALAHAVQVPDLDEDPDGSKGLMKDSFTSDTVVATLRSKPEVVAIRKRLQETAFFFPDLRTDSSGGVSFSFIAPESLTQWKWMTLAHTRDLAFGYSEKTIVTQKQLMVQPNLPRFLREGDKINISINVVNMTDSATTGEVGLTLIDPTMNETTDSLFGNRQPNRRFTVPARGSAVVEFPLDIPYGYDRPVSYRAVATAGAYSDGEEAVLPVVSNRMLVTETLPLNLPADGTKSFRFEKLLQSGNSKTLSNHALTLEFTANPAWYAVEALPYLIEFPYECAEQTFDRLYANAVASKIVQSSPRIAKVFGQWRTLDTAALLSNLEKNPELKSVLLEETPWVLEGKTETQQKKNIALLFDLTRLSGQLETAIQKLDDLQASSGGFSWFKGGQEDQYITQYILTGLGRMKRERALPEKLGKKMSAIAENGLAYADREATKDYKKVKRLSEQDIQYLYMRSFFPDQVAGPAVRHFEELARQEWTEEEPYMQGMIALALFRTGDQQTARAILASLRETAIVDPEQGMYWKGMEGGYYWYQAPVETEALLIEAFREIAHDTAADRRLKTWLLRQKQTHQWATTRATADACYALLTGSEDWLDQQRTVVVQLGEKRVEMAGEAGTGYDKKVLAGSAIEAAMGNINVTMSAGNPGGASVKTGGSPAWGAIYWQYFDQLDRITAAENGKVLRVEKRLFIQRSTDRGLVLDTIPENGTLHVGDRVVVRLVVRADRDLEYVHLKDMRGACFEPLNVLSGYEWQEGLGYYQTTTDVSTEFFFSWVPRGTYVFEYPMVMGQKGAFSCGVANVECLYAPEFADHTEGIRVVSQ